MPDCGHGWSDDEDNAVIDLLVGIVRLPVVAIVGAGRAMSNTAGRMQESYQEAAAKRRQRKAEMKHLRLAAVKETLCNEQIEAGQLRAEAQVVGEDLQRLEQLRHARLRQERSSQNKDVQKMNEALTRIIPQLPELALNNITLEENSKMIMAAVNDWLGEDISTHTTTELLAVFNVVQFIVEYEGNALTPLMLLNEVVDNQRRKPIPNELLNEFKLTGDEILGIKTSQNLDALVQSKVLRGLRLNH